MKIRYYFGNRIIQKGTVLIFVIIAFVSCKKYLDAKPANNLVIPSTLSDLQAILDNTSTLNESPSYGEASADDYFLSDDNYNTLDDGDKEAYIWQNFSYDNYPNDWARIYDVIYPSNIAIEGVEKIVPTEQTQLEWNNIKGSALVFRALSLLEGAFIFCNTYDSSNAKTDLGMVIRLNSDFNAPSKRSSLQETYDKIIIDLKEAAPLLPATPINVFRPSKAAAYAILARTYLSMRKYDSCIKYSNLCLQIKNDLFDYNTITDINSYAAFPQFNIEVIMVKLISQPVYYCIFPSIATVDSNLYNSYSDNDLRKLAFFEPILTGHDFKGTYSGNPYSSLFTGLATDEVYLMDAECNARLGNKDSALSYLNKLIKTIWRTGLFIPYTANSSMEALQLILDERRKELVFRNLRWMDIKRYNKDGANITLTRNINGQTYVLPPNDKRYALPLPMDIVKSTGVVQNPL